jgi:hypothetical protein
MIGGGRAGFIEKTHWHFLCSSYPLENEKRGGDEQ